MTQGEREKRSGDGIRTILYTGAVCTLIAVVLYFANTFLGIAL